MYSRMDVFDDELGEFAEPREEDDPLDAWFDALAKWWHRLFA